MPVFATIAQNVQHSVLSENCIFPHRDKASHVSKPSVISQRRLTTSVLDCKWNHTSESVCMCVWLSFCQCLTEQSAVGVLCSQEEDTFGMKQSSSVLQSVRAGLNRLWLRSLVGVCIQRGRVKIDRWRLRDIKQTAIFYGCLEVKTKEDFLCVIWIRKVG